uniref:7-cyano-7-deazaguanine synthase n=1 Tax=uncultured marine group II/III euryarchaeote KM3_141_C12 TaxID=1457877 RepID=A0A075GAI6_9EURY|nr:PP-loop domain-containing protein (queC) [uncultured marine group II/III euryarchaeote KM3_141_C12]
MEAVLANTQVDVRAMSRVVMALSGGMDSTALLLRMLARGDSVTCISYDYGQKHAIELERASANIAYLRSEGHMVDHVEANLSSVMSSFASALTDADAEVPEGHYEEKQMKKTVVPNRNAIFTSILYGHALSISTVEDCEVSLALGVHSGDHSIYPDCRPEFYDQLMLALDTGNWGSERISIDLPYIDTDKEGILRDALDSCGSLGVDFDVVFANTNTSYSPDSAGRSSGKTGSDVERILAFHAIGRKDPVEYVDDWETVLERALEIEREYEVVQ